MRGRRNRRGGRMQDVAGSRRRSSGVLGKLIGSAVSFLIYDLYQPDSKVKQLIDRVFPTKSAQVSEPEKKQEVTTAQYKVISTEERQED